MNIKRGILSGAVVGAAFVISAVTAAIINPLPYIFQNGTTADAGQVNADFAQIVSNVNSNAQAISTAFVMPAGAVVAFNLTTCPVGWLLSDGTNGTTDLRGYFVRGLGGIDVGRTLGSVQQDQVQDHKHNENQAVGGTAFGSGSTFAFNANQTVQTSNPVTGNHGLETRPKNVALTYCQKS